MSVEPPLRYPPDDPQVFQALNEIGIIAQLASTAFERVMPEGLSMAGFSVLNHLARLPGAWGPARLARAFQVTKGAMTNTVQRLERAGHVEVRADAVDGRAKIVSITPAGRRARDTAIRALGPQLAIAAEALSAAEFDQLLRLLSRLRAQLDAARD
jgi:DNA-binding MarR family transcriptional regulator